ncbi:hypothetical protein DL96DRAFT_1551281 [Flagelloscypha sp. PMI_526]|nr:hypothetical protein DL96DRAFT_1551281 [Flagelloscypha sp. PMI_526]
MLRQAKLPPSLSLQTWLTPPWPPLTPHRAPSYLKNFFFKTVELSNSLSVVLHTSALTVKSYGVRTRFPVGHFGSLTHFALWVHHNLGVPQIQEVLQLPLENFIFYSYEDADRILRELLSENLSLWELSNILGGWDFGTLVPLVNTQQNG